MPDANQIACPHCGQTYAVQPEQWGQYLEQTINCTRCGKPFTVAAAGAPNQYPPAQSAAFQAPGMPLPYAPDNSRGKRHRWVIGGAWMGGVTAVIAIGIGILVPTLRQMRSQRGAQLCPSHMNQVCLGIAMHARGHQGNLPADLGEVLEYQGIPPAVFVCPESTDTPASGPTQHAMAANLLSGGHLSYVYLGKGLTEQTARNDVVILYEPSANHGGAGMNVAFGDYHTEWVPGGQQILKQVADGVFPVRLDWTTTQPTTQSSMK